MNENSIDLTVSLKICAVKKDWININVEVIDNWE